MSLFKYPKSIILLSVSSNVNLIVHGQGVFIFDNKDNTKECSFTFYNKDKTDGLVVNFKLNSITVNRVAVLNPLLDPNNKDGLSTLNGAFYWFSLDSYNQQLFAGIGEPRMETVAYQYKFTKDEGWEKNKEFLESLVNIEISENSTALKQLKLLRDPITLNIPLVVKNTENLTMEDIAKGTYLPKANLSLTSQKLYDCISGKNFVLNTPDFPDFVNAIEYSIATPNMWCNKRLLEKATEFNKDKPNVLETYLRITLGQNNGESPGIPYVMEIWPVNHYSPIHSHSNADAIIRVLNGDIHVKLFPFLCAEKDTIQPFASRNFTKDEITWISPTLNQTHQLKNLNTNTQTCITVQCYMYDKNDTTHYDYFDYIDADGNKQQYEPDSDMDFVEFKKTMKEEWDNKLKNDIAQRKKSCFNFLWK
jgi:hypothetical protein